MLNYMLQVLNSDTTVVRETKPRKFKEVATRYFIGNYTINLYKSKSGPKFIIIINKYTLVSHSQTAIFSFYFRMGKIGSGILNSNLWFQHPQFSMGVNR